MYLWPFLLSAFAWKHIFPISAIAVDTDTTPARLCAFTIIPSTSKGEPGNFSVFWSTCQMKNLRYNSTTQHTCF